MGNGEDLENVAGVYDSDGKPQLYVEVPVKRKYYILVTMDSGSRENRLQLFWRKEYFLILKNLIDTLAGLAGKDNVVWVSETVDGTNDNDWENKQRIKRQPKRQDFIDAHNDDSMRSKYDGTNTYDPHRGVVFYYGHGNKDMAGLIFSDNDLKACSINFNTIEYLSNEHCKKGFCHGVNNDEYIVRQLNNGRISVDNRMSFVRDITPRPENLTSAIRNSVWDVLKNFVDEMESEQKEKIRSRMIEFDIKTIFGEKGAEPAEFKYTNILSKNYVCYQYELNKFLEWRKKLPYVEFYSEYRIGETLAAQLLLNDLVDEINGIEPGTHNEQYKFVCKSSCISQSDPNSQVNRCRDVIECKDPEYREGRKKRGGELEIGKFKCITQCINKNNRCENISLCDDELYRSGEKKRTGWMEKIS
jgi:hypothetical protein